jgi:hypothetical protein
MNDIEVTDEKGITIGILTTEHPASSYGRPVLVVGGVTYGPRDVLSGNGAVAAYAVSSWATNPFLPDDAYTMAAAFLSQWPEGPQISVLDSDSPTHCEMCGAELRNSSGVYYYYGLLDKKVCVQCFTGAKRK